MDSKGLAHIANYYGLNNQLNQTIEECSELIKECSKSIRYCIPTDGLVEEIADVYVMINQLAYLLKVPKQNVYDIVDSKIKRQIERIEKEKLKIKGEA